ncbi:MAG: lipid-A-disaccharide synthase [Lentisphaeria bacterium]|nr:lipid-A-disaccharide synthase [Lentisphaeria bacterium]
MNDAPKRVIWIVAGETSGDGYGATVALRLREQCRDVIIRGMGGERMREAGVETFVDSTELGIIGFWEALKHLFFFMGLLKRMVARAASERPDTVVLIDYPGFNLQLAKRLHKLGIRVVWYVSPQVWAWRSGRIWKLADCCDRMLCIFPFEPECYAPTKLKAEFVGHPLLEILKPYREKVSEREDDLVLLLPGSRRQELQRLMPSFVDAAVRLHRSHPNLRFEFAMPRQAILDYAKELLPSCADRENWPEFQWSCGETRARMRTASCAIAASGTVTVEAAILGLPVVVAYKLSAITWWMAKRVIKISTITIANLVCKKTVFEERLQDDCTGEKLADALEKLLPDGERREEVVRLMAEFTQRLGAVGDVSDNVARIVLDEKEELQKKN